MKRRFKPIGSRKIYGFKMKALKRRVQWMGKKNRYNRKIR